MRSRDGFEVVNELMRDEVNRRAVLKMLGLSAVGLAGGLPLASLAHAQKPKYGGAIRIGSFSNIEIGRAHV